MVISRSFKLLHTSHDQFSADLDFRCLPPKRYRVSLSPVSGPLKRKAAPSDARYSQPEYLADEKSLDTAARMSHVQYFMRILFTFGRPWVPRSPPKERCRGNRHSLLKDL
jgi:hypothetical protein